MAEVYEIEGRKNSYEMVRISFGHLNEFKRQRTKATYNRHEGDETRENYHLLKAYESIDALELSLRAIQSIERNRV